MERYRDGSTFEAIASYCRATRRGETINVSGTAALDVDGTARYPNDAYSQTREALERSVAAVEELGGSLHDIMRTRLLLTPGCDWREAVRAHHDVFDGVDPANTTYFVAGLIPEGALVEVEVDARVETTSLRSR